MPAAPRPAHLVLTLAILGVTAAQPAVALGATVRAGSVSAEVNPSPWRFVVQREGKPLLRQAGGRGTGATGALGFRAGGRWWRATRAVTSGARGRGFAAVLATTDPAGRRLDVRVDADGRGAVLLHATVIDGPTADVEAIGMAFGAPPGERHLGFGERSNAVDQRGRTIENYVGEGPYEAGDYPIVASSIPPWGIRRRPDATYFPMPWLLSTRGYGVLADNTEESRFRLGSDRRDAWSVEVQASELRLRFIAARSPAAVVRALTDRVGRQPPPVAPWMLGPWFQTGHDDKEPAEGSHIRTLRRGDAPISAVETHMRYMPCGNDRGNEASERTRTAGFHRDGLAAMTYLREAVCASYQPIFSEGVVGRLFLKHRDGSPYTYRAFVGGRVTDIGQIDFGAGAAEAFHARLLGRAVANGYDGWMEDYGEYTPPDSISSNGLGGLRFHNLYPILYHRSGQRFADRQRRPIARFTRSGWTGVHRYTPIVWGGDPSTTFGFDGLQSAVKQALSIGLSGIGVWASDVGGFFTFTGDKLTPELLHRWIEFGAVSGVMRTKAEGIGLPASERPQIWEKANLPLWRRYAKLRTQLYPYISAAAADYRRTGLPLMRHLALVAPSDSRATAREDEFMFGPDLLAAPVLEQGRRSRRVYLPAGRWVDLWRSARYERTHGGLRLRRARVLRGRRTVRLPAPLDELPLLARAGTLLPLLSPDVDTLADYGRGGRAVRLRDRAGRMRLLAFPRGSSSARMGVRGRLSSVEGRRGVWRLRVRGERRRRFELQASLRTLRRPFVPTAVRVNGRRLSRRAWRYERRTQVLRVRFAARRASVRVSG
jgi:alpha-glucosidase (family GH31 glycosyl hydrolase)